MRLRKRQARQERLSTRVAPSTWKRFQVSHMLGYFNLPGQSSGHLQPHGGIMRFDDVRVALDVVLDCCETIDEPDGAVNWSRAWKLDIK